MPTNQPDLEINKFGIDQSKTVTFKLKGINQDLIKIETNPFKNNFNQTQAIPENSRLNFNYYVQGASDNESSILTVIPDKNETEGYLSTIDGKNSIDIGDFSGWILNHDLKGNFLEGFTFENGFQLGALKDPSGFPIPIASSSSGPGEEPEDRLHCYEVTTTNHSRTCWYQDGSFIGCESWSVTGSSTEEHCFTEPDGGGGGSGGEVNNYEERVVDHTERNADCWSWNFIPVGPDGDYQACGVSNVTWDYLASYLDGTGNLTVELVFAQHSVLYFEFPHIRENDDIITPGAAAMIMAKAKDVADKAVEIVYKNQPKPMNSTLEAAYITAFNAVVVPLGGRVTKQNFYGNVPVRNFSDIGWGNGNCN